ncbi:hypothetical protein [Labrys neptuniae]
MIKTSFLETPISWSDVTTKVEDTTVPSSQLEVDLEHVSTSVSFINPGNAILPSIRADASIAVGQISFENLGREDWSFGFAQALKVRECVVEYAGTRSNAGSVVVSAFDLRDREPVFTDSHQDTPLDQRPWTRVKEERFTYFRSRGMIKLGPAAPLDTPGTVDAPGMRVPAVIGNGATNADNFLRRISDKREICCVLAVEDSRIFTEPQILGHSLWTIDLSFVYRWSNNGKTLLRQFVGAISLGQFREGLPAEARYHKMFDKSFVNGEPYNFRASVILNRHIRALKSDRKDEHAVRLSSVPRDFFL